jgi:YbbR domain-containing protein
LLGNFRLKLIAIFFAIALWSVVAYASNPTQTRTVPMAVGGLQTIPTGLTLVGDPPRVAVKVIATADDQKSFDQHDLTVSANFARVHVGTNQVPIRVDNTDSSVQVDAPGTIDVQIDQLASATLNVALQRVHSLPTGYHEQTNLTTVTPATVRVDGPKSLLNGLQASAVIDLDNVNPPSVAIPSAVVVSDGKKAITSHLTITPPQVTIKMVVAADAITVNKAVGFTLTGQPAQGYRVTNVQVTPLEVQATGLQNALGTVAVLATDSIDISNQKSDVIRTVTIRPPNGVDVTPKTASIHVFISAIPGVSPSASP